MSDHETKQPDPLLQSREADSLRIMQLATQIMEKGIDYMNVANQTQKDPSAREIDVVVGRLVQICAHSLRDIAEATGSLLPAVSKEMN